MDKQALLDAATAVRERAYAPYSRYRVGAAILDSDGNLHAGCNVENASSPEGCCAEANAIGQMVAAGGCRIRAIAVTGAADADGSKFEDTDECTPCGGCRQRILEFSDEDTEIVLQNAAGEATSYRIDELLPKSFRANPT